MGKLIFSILAGYGVFVSLLALHVITPLVDSVDARLGANASVRLIVPGDIPLPSSLVMAINTHPALAMHACEGTVIVLISWSVLLLVTHWTRQFRSAVRQRRNQALLASRRIAALACQAPDTWA